MRVFSTAPLLWLFAAPISAWLAGCTGSTDSAAPADTDSGVDSDTDAEDTAPDASGVITGTIVGYDGPVGDVEVQACETTCFSTHADGAGMFIFSEMSAGEYKIDAVGEAIAGKDYGRIRVHGTLADDASTWTAPAPLFLPQMFGPTVVATTGTYTFGPVEWTVDPSILTLAPGLDDDTYSVGVVAGADIGAFWPVTPSLGVAFGPLATAVAGSFDVAVTSDIAAGTYDVYSVDAHGEIEGPVGTATADGATVAATVTPTLLTWLLFVPTV